MCADETLTVRFKNSPLVVDLLGLTEELGLDTDLVESMDWFDEDFQEAELYLYVLDTERRLARGGNGFRIEYVVE